MFFVAHSRSLMSILRHNDRYTPLRWLKHRLFERAAALQCLLVAVLFAQSLPTAVVVALAKKILCAPFWVQSAHTGGVAKWICALTARGRVHARGAWPLGGYRGKRYVTVDDNLVWVGFPAHGKSPVSGVWCLCTNTPAVHQNTKQGSWKRKQKQNFWDLDACFLWNFLYKKYVGEDIFLNFLYKKLCLGWRTSGCFHAAKIAFPKAAIPTPRAATTVAIGDRHDIGAAGVFKHKASTVPQ